MIIVKDLDTPAGYVKLQLVINGEPCTDQHMHIVRGVTRKGCFKTDKTGRIVLFDFAKADGVHVFTRSKNKPALKSEKNPFDIVRCFRCKTWSSIAQDWLSRHRLYGWPTTDTIQELNSLGFFVIKKGHPLSSEIDLEWRISLSLQELKIMFNLTDVQHKCYFVLKLLNRDIIKLNYISSYHWKTCLFYVIEGNTKNIWERELVWHCVKLCIKQMLEWVKYGFCPNYFISKDNLFGGKLNQSQRSISEKRLEKLIHVGFNCFLYVKSHKVCDYVKSRKSIKDFELKMKHSQKVYREELIILTNSIIENTGFIFNIRILDHYFHASNENNATFIKFLWERLSCTQEDVPITEHTEEETKRSLSLLKPHIYMSLASNISAMAIQHQNPKVYNLLLLGSFICFFKGGITGRLKFISILYKIGLFTDCEWFLDQEDEHCIKYYPSLCICRFINNAQKMAEYRIALTSHIQKCVHAFLFCHLNFHSFRMS